MPKHAGGARSGNLEDAGGENFLPSTGGGPSSSSQIRTSRSSTVEAMVSTSSSSSSTLGRRRRQPYTEREWEDRGLYFYKKARHEYGNQNQSRLRSVSLERPNRPTPPPPPPTMLPPQSLPNPSTTRLSHPTPVATQVSLTKDDANRTIGSRSTIASSSDSRRSIGPPSLLTTTSEIITTGHCRHVPSQVTQVRGDVEDDTTPTTTSTTLDVEENTPLTSNSRHRDPSQKQDELHLKSPPTTTLSHRQMAHHQALARRLEFDRTTTGTASRWTTTTVAATTNNDDNYSTIHRVSLKANLTAQTNDEIYDDDDDDAQPPDWDDDKKDFETQQHVSDHRDAHREESEREETEQSYGDDGDDQHGAVLLDSWRDDNGCGSHRVHLHDAHREESEEEVTGPTCYDDDEDAVLLDCAQSWTPTFGRAVVRGLKQVLYWMMVVLVVHCIKHELSLYVLATTTTTTTNSSLTTWYQSNDFATYNKSHPSYWMSIGLVILECHQTESWIDWGPHPRSQIVVGLSSSVDQSQTEEGWSTDTSSSSSMSAPWYRLGTKTTATTTSYWW